MLNNLNSHASTQYGTWEGTLSGDEVDMHSLAELLGVDEGRWSLLVVDVYVDGGSQSIDGWAVPAGMDGYDILRRQIKDTGRIDVVKVVERNEEPHDHSDTNPPDPPVVPLTYVTDLIAFGFKRLHIRMTKLERDLREMNPQIVEVPSIAEEEGV